MTSHNASAEAFLALGKDALTQAGEGEVEVFLRSNRRGIARFAGGALGQHMELEEPLVVVRVADGRRIAETATSRIACDDIVRAIHAAKQAARFVPETEGFAGFAGAHEPTGENPPRFVRTTDEATAEERVHRLAPVLRRIDEESLVSAGVLETRTTHVAVATTRGLSRALDSTLATFKVWALETPGAGGSAGYGGDASLDLHALAMEEETERAVRICKMSRAPGSIEEGAYDVVMEPAAVAELVEWLALIAFGAPEVEQGTSPLAGRIGERITGEKITLTESALDPTETGLALPFDREGVWRREVPLVVNGLAQGVLYDRIHALRAGRASTGSSLMPDPGSPASVGASAVHLAPGTAASVDELIRGVDRGLYVCRVHYVNGFLDPRRAVMTGLTRDGCFLVEKGKIVRAVGNVRFTDSFLEGLVRCDGMTRARRAIPMSSTDGGVCVVPAVRMRGFRFTGGSQKRGMV